MSGPCGQFGCVGPLTAGNYVSQALDPAVTYTLTTPWVNLRDWPEFFQLYPDTPANRAVAAAGGYPLHILVLPGPVMVSPSARCVGDSPTDEITSNAARFVDFVTTRKAVTASEPMPATLSGLTGRQIDVATEPGWTGCLPGAPLGEALTPADRVRFIVFDRPGGDSLMIRLRLRPTSTDSSKRRCRSSRASGSTARTSQVPTRGSLGQRFPRFACSRSIASKRALKLPTPKPREPCRSMISKKNVGRSWTGRVKIWRR